MQNKGKLLISTDRDVVTFCPKCVTSRNMIQITMIFSNIRSSWRRYCRVEKSRNDINKWKVIEQSSVKFHLELIPYEIFNRNFLLRLFTWKWLNLVLLHHLHILHLNNTFKFVTLELIYRESINLKLILELLVSHHYCFDFALFLLLDNSIS